MTTTAEKAEVKAMIQSFYKFANVVPVWNGEVNDEVAEVFGVMLSETAKCSTAFSWVPKPPTGRTSVTWLASQLERGVFNNMRQRLSFTCARAVILKWKTPMEMATIGIAMARLQKWA